jgi:photosystem II stability/assembly factor-like uncharacterized protein
MPRHRLLWGISLLLTVGGIWAGIELLGAPRPVSRVPGATGARRIQGPPPGQPVQPPSMPAMGKAAGKIPNDWFHVQRAWPGVEINAEARALALEEARALRATSRGKWQAGRDAWSEAGPLNIGGRVTALAVHPSLPQRIFAGAADGGVFRSDDGGGSWTPVFDEIGNLSIGALAIDPSDPATVYAGTGEANASGDSFAGIGLLRSTDAGAHWSLLGLESSRHINRIVIDPTNPQKIYVACMGALFSKTPDRGLYRTTDGGTTWERTLFLSDSTGVIDVVLDPSQPSRLYAATWERLRTPKYRRGGGTTCGVWRSLDSGSTWTRLGSGLPGISPSVGRIGLALCTTQSQVVYAIYADNTGYFSGLYKSINGGDSWTRTSDAALSDLYGSYGWYFGNVRVDPADPNRVYAMGLDIYRSTSGGSGWAYVSSNVHVDQHDLWIDPNQSGRWIAGGDGGLYVTTSSGAAWTHVETLPITQFYAGAVDTQNPARLYGGSQDNGTVRTWGGGLNDWEMIYGGDGFYALVDPGNSNTIYAEYQYGGLAKSTDGGSGFSSCVSGINSGDRRNWSTPVVFDPANASRLYYGTYRLYRTTNGASSWSAISGDLTGGVGDASLVYATITTIAVSPSNGQVIYVGTDDGRVWRTANGGTTWQNLSAGLPQRWVTRVAVDPVNADIAYVTHSGYRNDSPLAHAHRTVDGGQTWTAIDAGLPEAPVNALVIDPQHPNWLFAGTDVGVFFSSDAGAEWSDMAPGMPIVVIHDLVLHNPSRTLTAFTHGRSVYRVPLPTPSAVDAGGEGGPAITEAARAVGLLSIQPNPLGRRGPGTEISYRAPGAAPVELAIFDAAGRQVRLLKQAGGGSEGTRDGLRVARFDGRDDSGRWLPAGTYFARIAGPAGTDSQRLTVLP